MNEEDTYDDFLYFNMTDTETRLDSDHDSRKSYFFMMNITNHLDLINFKGFIAEWFYTLILNMTILLIIKIYIGYGKLWRIFFYSI